MHYITDVNDGKCPFCETFDIEIINRSYPSTKDGGGMEELCACNVCDDRWFFVYKLVGWHND